MNIKNANIAKWRYYLRELYLQENLIPAKKKEKTELKII